MGNCFKECKHQIIMLSIAIFLVGCASDSPSLPETMMEEASPAPVEEMSIIDVEAASTWHSLLLKEDGTVWVWGNNRFGALSNNDLEYSSLPVKIETLSEIIAISSGSLHSVALAEDGTVWIWGGSQYWQQGIIAEEEQSYPIQITRLPEIQKIATSMALDANGQVWVWGYDTYLQANQVEKSFYQLVPQKIDELPKIIDIDAGAVFSAALTEDGHVWVWGLKYEGEDVNQFDPMVINGLIDIVDISVGFDHLLALDRDGFVWAYGGNDYGQLGNGDEINSEYGPSIMVEEPVKVMNISNIRYIETGVQHSAAIDEDGTLWVWGSNKFGLLGIGEEGEKHSTSIPVRVDLPGKIVTVSTSTHCLVLLDNDTIWGWGDNSLGAIRDPELGSLLTSPVLVYPINEE